MGGSSGTIDSSFLGAQPQQGQPLNFNRLLGQAQKAGDSLWNQQQGYIGSVENQLRNSEAIQAGFGALNDARAAGYSMQAAEGQLGSLGSMLSNQAGQAFRDAGPTSIERTMYKQGEQELALGRQLSPEQLREAAQTARAAMQARGLATSNAGIGAELLNRDAYASKREADRRTYAMTANNNLSNNVLARRQGALGLATGAGNMYQSQGSLAGQRYGLGLQTAQMYQQLDPVSNAYQLGSGLAQNTAMGGLDFAGNLATFNTNRQDSLYNSWMNNMASVQAANQQAQAASNAGTMGLLGSLGSSAFGAAGVALAPATGGLSLAAPSATSLWGQR